MPPPPNPRAMPEEVRIACNFGSGNFVASPDRYTSCGETYWEVFQYDNDEVVGHINFLTYQGIRFSGKDTTWTHSVEVLATEGRGTMEDGTSLVVSPSCVASPDCSMVSSDDPAWSSGTTLGPGDSYINTFTETDTSAVSTATTGQVAVDQSPLGVTVEGVGGAAGFWSLDDTYMRGRCDFDATFSYPRGCVNDDFIPTLVLSQSQSGSSATFVDWAQRHLTAHWGLKGSGEPLHYNRTGGSRSSLCGPTYFTQDAAMNAALAVYNDTDSCDEFPFNKTYESPAVTGVPSNGTQCAQVTAIQSSTPSNTNEAADWRDVAPLGAYAASALCARGHIPGKLNSSVGGKFSQFLNPTGQRLIDGDPFWVAVGA